MHPFQLDSIQSLVTLAPVEDGLTYNGFWIHENAPTMRFAAYRSMLKKLAPSIPIQRRRTAGVSFRGVWYPIASDLSKDELHSLLERALRYRYANVLPTPYQEGSRLHKEELKRQRAINTHSRLFYGGRLPDDVAKAFHPYLRRWVAALFRPTPRRSMKYIKDPYLKGYFAGLELPDGLAMPKIVNDHLLRHYDMHYKP